MRAIRLQNFRAPLRMLAGGKFLSSQSATQFAIEIVARSRKCVALSRSRAHALTHLLVGNCFDRLTRSRTRALTHSRTHALTHSRTHALMLSRTHAFTHSRTHALTHPRAHEFTHSRTHALMRFLDRFYRKST